MRLLTWAALAAFAALLIAAGAELPDLGDPAAPAHLHVAATYLENALADARTPNVVTAVLADYRSFDTLGETVVVFTAALGCLALLKDREPVDSDG